MTVLGYFSLFLHKSIHCGYSSEAPCQAASNEYPQHMFLWRTGENYPRFIIKNSSVTSSLLSTLSKIFSRLHIEIFFFFFPGKLHFI